MCSGAAVCCSAGWRRSRISQNSWRKSLRVLINETEREKGRGLREGRGLRRRYLLRPGFLRMIAGGYTPCAASLHLPIIHHAPASAASLHPLACGSSGCSGTSTRRRSAKSWLRQSLARSAVCAAGHCRCMQQGQKRPLEAKQLAVCNFPLKAFSLIHKSSVLQWLLH